jgi:holin-like protein
VSNRDNAVAYVAIDRDRAAHAHGPSKASRSIRRYLPPAAADLLRTTVIIGSQLLGLWALYFAGVWLVGVLHLPVPGNLVGLVALYALLSLGVVKISWFEPLGSLLIKHLAFFFVPVTVGLMDAAGFLLSHVVAITVALVASAAAGLVAAGLVSQMIINRAPRL